MNNLQFRFVGQIADDDPVHSARLFVVGPALALYLRAAYMVGREIWRPKMEDLWLDRMGSWCFRVIGNGNKAVKTSAKGE